MAWDGTTAQSLHRGEVPVDPFRAFVFPNRLRELRRANGFAKLLPFAGRLPHIPYIRLSKIERGEVVARPEELRQIADALSVPAEALLVDVGAPEFDMAAWAEPFFDPQEFDPAEERFAVLLAAALRARRTTQAGLSIATIDHEYGLPPVNLSRVENAAKPFPRWNVAIRSALLRLFDARDEAELRSMVMAMHGSGALDSYIEAIGSPDAHRARTAARIAELREALREERRVIAVPPAVNSNTRMLPVHGAPAAGGLIAPVVTEMMVEAPNLAGLRAIALRVGRATLGPGLPAHAVVIADPDRYPASGALAALREGDGWRLLATTSDRDGRLVGHSVHPAHEVVLDELDPACTAAVVAVVFP